MRDETEKLPTLDSHIDNGYGTETMVYNRKRKEKGGGGGTKTKGRKEVEERQR